jgi:hypothetical protein
MHLAENPDHAMTLNPVDPNSLVLVDELFNELTPNFQSRLLHVGCDEAILGKGWSKAACEEKGIGRVYMDYLLDIHRLVKQQDRTMLFWADIVLHYPEVIKDMPKDMVAMVWGYEAQHPFLDQGQKMKDAGIPFYVCPGVSSWGSPLGRTDVMLANIKNAAENGLKTGAIGFLNCDWGDYIGDWEHWTISYPGFAYGAAMSWAVESNKELDLARAMDRHVLMDEADVLGQLLLDLGKTYKETGVMLWDRTLLAAYVYYQNDPLDSPNLKDGTIENLTKTIESIETLLKDLDQVKMKHPDARLIIDEVRNDAAIAIHFSRIGMARIQSQSASISTIPDDLKKELAQDIDPIIPEFRRLWLQRNRPGGLDQTAGVFENLLKVYSKD